MKNGFFKKIQKCKSLPSEVKTERKRESCFREEVDVDIKRQKKEARGRRARAHLDAV